MIEFRVFKNLTLAMKAGHMEPNDLRRIAEDFLQQATLLSERYRSSMSRIARELSKVSSELSKYVITPITPYYQQLEASSKHLAELGWTIPMHFTIGEIVALSDPANSDEDIEKCIVDSYLCDEHKQLRRLYDGLMTSEDFMQWHPLLRQCFEAFELNLHLVIIPSLISVLEGAITQKFSTLSTKNVHIIKPTQEKALQANPNSMKYFIWSNLATFLGKLYEKSDFSKGRPLFLNRHWILHGRDSTQWTVADAIRLFNALCSVV